MLAPDDLVLHPDLNCRQYCSDVAEFDELKFVAITD